jgi:hypothetical protein
MRGRITSALENGEDIFKIMGISRHTNVERCANMIAAMRASTITPAVSFVKVAPNIESRLAALDPR